MILALLDEAVAAGARLEKACGVLGLAVRTVARWRADEGGGHDRRAEAGSAPIHKLTPEERDTIIRHATSAEYRDLSPRADRAPARRQGRLRRVGIELLPGAARTRADGPPRAIRAKDASPPEGVRRDRAKPGLVLGHHVPSQLRTRRLLLPLPRARCVQSPGRAAGVLLPTCDTENFVAKLEKTTLDEPTKNLIAPLVALLRALEPELARVEQTLAGFAQKDPILNLCATVPGVGLIVAATFVSVIDEAKRFKNAHAVGAYLGLVPSESTTGGPNKRRLGSITKQGNRMARAMLVQAAWTILRSRDRDDPLKRWADHLANTRGKRIAVVALARKLAGVLWAMWRDGTVYDRAEQAEKAAHGLKVAARKQHHRADALERAAKKLRRKEVTENASTSK